MQPKPVEHDAVECAVHAGGILAQMNVHCELARKPHPSLFLEILAVLLFWQLHFFYEANTKARPNGYTLCSCCIQRVHVRECAHKCSTGSENTSMHQDF
ncbi:hypothetical protein DUNSADRAFT_10012 [Dunaliella salina]|uniref:Encoded protein n=1 Tax=Dunaliella salina TaxID=3046 RepID=A0ABQ7GG97_DUNSA|nr:hypothetical protein DUNSADRAFT_10012 [Dunaliella salina]|eukprot:KAF5833633.1 hypothetical protein DUNSADRAFT_10012 [Dunaliella salina]